MSPSLDFVTAFLAGLVSFVSPCVLPLVPAYLSFLTGSSLEELRAQEAGSRLRILGHAGAFCAGFTMVFTAAGLLASRLGATFAAERDVLARVGGVLVIVFALNMLGVFRLTALSVDRRLRIGKMQRSFGASMLIGVGFAAGWSPCIGPILASILVIAAAEPTGIGAALLFVYSLGLALPFFAVAAAFGAAGPWLARIKSKLRPIEIGAGSLLLVTGIVLVTLSFSRVTSFLSGFTDLWQR